jgi:hypothetical protein
MHPSSSGGFPPGGQASRTGQRVILWMRTIARRSTAIVYVGRQVILVGLESAVVGPGPKERATGIEPA